MSDITTATTDAEFEAALAADVPVLIDFTATWCGPCKALAPVLEQLASQWGSDVSVVKVDADALPEVTARYGVQGLPTLILMEDGDELMRMTGSISKAALTARMAPFI